MSTAGVGLTILGNSLFFALQTPLEKLSPSLEIYLYFLQVFFAVTLSQLQAFQFSFFRLRDRIQDRRQGNLEDGRGDGIDVQKDLEFGRGDRIDIQIRPRFYGELQGGDLGDPQDYEYPVRSRQL